MKDLDDLSIELFMTISERDESYKKSDLKENPYVTQLERDNWYLEYKKLEKKALKVEREIDKLEGIIPVSKNNRKARNLAVSTYLTMAFLKQYPNGVFPRKFDSQPHFYGFVEKYADAGNEEQFIEIGAVKIDIDEVVEQEYIVAGFYGRPTKKVKNLTLKSAFHKVKSKMKTHT